MGSQQTIKPSPGLVNIPASYPAEPTPGKLQILWGANFHSLYHKLSPYANYNQSLIGGFTTQPYLYTFIDETGQGLNSLMKYDSRVFPIGSAPKDIIRVSKFLGSGNGIIFLGKQFLLQSGNAFNETRIYNPTSPIVAAGMGLGLGFVRPQRNFDTSGGLAGIVKSLVGVGTADVNPPSGTTGTGALPTVNVKRDGKGLLRAQTANRGLESLKSKWSGKGGSHGFLKSVFANYIPQTQDGIDYNSSEGAYGLMIADKKNRLWYTNTIVGMTIPQVSPFQMWIAGGKGMRKNGEVNPAPAKLFGHYGNINGRNSFPISAKSLNAGGNLEGVGHVGHTRDENTNPNKPGIRYGDNVGTSVDKDYAASDIMVNYKYYTDPKETYVTARTENSVVQKHNETLKKVIQKLKAVSDGAYEVNVPADAKVISSGESTKNGYTRLFNGNKKNSSANFYPDGVMKDYGKSVVVDNSLISKGSNNKSYKLPTAGHFDALNTLQVLDKDKEIKNSKLKNWTKWEPYNDDLIAFFFYDVVNEKYIPFRATVKGLAEAITSTWEELPFIGRADKVYTYGGFNRNLSLGFSINISSISELAPTWQRINYLASLAKPANYTSKGGVTSNRFMIPPMVMLTVGDMYKDQPILLNSITITIPDDATWETQNEYNSSSWEYLAGYIKSSKFLYGQLPRTVEISLGIILLEKERAIVGGANFGHAPRTDDLKNWNVNTTPESGRPNNFHESLVVTDGNSPIYSKEEEDAIDYSNGIPLER